MITFVFSQIAFFQRIHQAAKLIKSRLDGTYSNKESPEDNEFQNSNFLLSVSCLLLANLDRLSYPLGPGDPFLSSGETIENDPISDVPTRTPASGSNIPKDHRNDFANRSKIHVDTMFLYPDSR